MFIDRVELILHAGDGGHGMASFRREKYVPLGGPSGGDGGRGGNIIFVANRNLSTLIELKYKKVLKANKGDNGMSKSQNGHSATDIYVKVPPGTIIINKETNLVIADLVSDGQEVIVAAGGRGGRGNRHFTSSMNTAPLISENGEPGQELNVIVELKLLADVGLVGLPSVGKSTILSVISAAKPKIAAYHFTTITPNIGVVETKDQRSFVAADLPGLIEGAHLGHGLGLQFLRHIERTRVILHVIDMGSFEGRDPFHDYTIIKSELKEFNEDLLLRKEIILANKMDLPGAKENLEIFKTKVDSSIPIFEVSAVSYSGFDAVLYYIADLLENTENFPLYSKSQYAENALFKFDSSADYTVHFSKEFNSWLLQGKELEKLFLMTNFQEEQSVKRFALIMKKMGVDEYLRSHGVQNGDIVRVLEFEFEFID